MFLFTRAHAIEKSLFVTFRFDVHKILTSSKYLIYIKCEGRSKNFNKRFKCRFTVKLHSNETVEKKTFLPLKHGKLETISTSTKPCQSTAIKVIVAVKNKKN